MIEVQDVEWLKKHRVNEWVKLQKEFCYLIYLCEEKMNHAQSKEGKKAAFLEGMNSLIDLLKD